MNKLILCAVGLYVTFHVVRGFPQGAPVQQESCYNLQPIHRDQRTQQLVANQTAQAPYKIFVSRQEYVPCTDQRQCPQGVIQGLFLDTIISVIIGTVRRVLSIFSFEANVRKVT